MQEESIYSDSNVSVTTTRVMIGGTTYALRNITSVRMALTPPQPGCANVLIISGIMLALYGGFGEFSQDGSRIAFFVCASAIIGGAIYWRHSLKSDYHIKISSSSGEANALTSKDKEYIEVLVNSINEAIVRY